VIGERSPFKRFIPSAFAEERLSLLARGQASLKKSFIRIIGRFEWKAERTGNDFRIEISTARGRRIKGRRRWRKKLGGLTILVIDDDDRVRTFSRIS